MYRTEMSMSSERKAVPLMLFEISELHNADILDYVRNHYKLPGILKRNIDEYIQNIDDIEEGDDNVEYMLREILSCIEDETGKTIKYALWLATKEAVEELYDGDEQFIFEYDVTDALILSDLGYDGVLYGFETMPEPLNSEEDKEEINESDKKEEYNMLMKMISKQVKDYINKL